MLTESDDTCVSIILHYQYIKSDNNKNQPSKLYTAGLWYLQLHGGLLKQQNVKMLIRVFKRAHTHEALRDSFIALCPNSQTLTKTCGSKSTLFSSRKDAHTHTAAVCGDSLAAEGVHRSVYKQQKYSFFYEPETPQYIIRPYHEEAHICSNI